MQSVPVLGEMLPEESLFSDPAGAGAEGDFLSTESVTSLSAVPTADDTRVVWHHHWQCSVSFNHQNVLLTNNDTCNAVWIPNSVLCVSENVVLVGGRCRLAVGSV